MRSNFYSFGIVPAKGHKGFNLVELLAVVAVVVVLTGILLAVFSPSPSRITRHAPGVICLNNSRRLNMALMMYAGDNNDRLVYNSPVAGPLANSTNNWVGGVMDWSANPQNTNLHLLLDAQLGPYLKESAVYHCPADKSVSAAGRRVRSYSMNAFVGDNRHGRLARGWKHFLKKSDFGHPGRTFIFLDEHPNSINDGWFVTIPDDTNAWYDLPASYHDGAGCFSFADGHSEIHRWLNPGTRQPVVPNGPKLDLTVPLTEADDITWIVQRTSQK